jgi:hypothetical protein
MSDALALRYARELEKPPRNLKKVVKLGSKISRLQIQYLREYLKTARGVEPTEDEVAVLAFLWNALGTIPIDAVTNGVGVDQLGEYLATILSPFGMLQFQYRAELFNSMREAMSIVKKKKGLLKRFFSR